MEETKLGKDDEQLRLHTEQEAVKHWPGARVLVHGEAGQYRAAVHLPEDGVSLAVSAESSEPRASPREALDEVLRTIKKQKVPALDA